MFSHNVGHSVLQRSTVEGFEVVRNGLISEGFFHCRMAIDEVFESMETRHQNLQSVLRWKELCFVRNPLHLKRLALRPKHRRVMKGSE